MTNNAGVPLDRRQLLSLRIARRMTQAEVAAALGCSTSHYRALEAGRVNASLALVDRLEKLHGQALVGVTFP